MNVSMMLNLKQTICVLLLLTISCSSAKQRMPERKAPEFIVEQVKKYPSPTPKLSADGKLTLFLPGGSWRSIFFESINERAKQSGLSDLTESRLSADDLELRVWSGFGLTGLRGFILKKTSGKWSALSLRPIINSDARNPTENYLEPESGWENFWHKLKNEGVLTLPDAMDVMGCSPGVRDGTSYVVEINTNGLYRTYMYGNPDYAECEEAKQMMRIACLIFLEMCAEEKRK